MAGSMNSPPGGSRPLRLSVLLPLLHPAVYTERVLVLLDRALHADGYARASAEAILAPVSGQSAAGPWRLHVLDGFERRVSDPP